MSILRASGRNARIARSSPIRWGPRMRNGSECAPERKVFSSSGGIPATEKGFIVSIQPRVRAWLFNDVCLRRETSCFVIPTEVEESLNISVHVARIRFLGLYHDQQARFSALHRNDERPNAT